MLTYKEINATFIYSQTLNRITALEVNNIADTKAMALKEPVLVQLDLAYIRSSRPNSMLLYSFVNSACFSSLGAVL